MCVFGLIVIETVGDRNDRLALYLLSNGKGDLYIVESSHAIVLQTRSFARQNMHC